MEGGQAFSGGRLWAHSALRPSRVKDESQIAGTRRPEGLLAGAGGRSGKSQMC